MTSPQVTPTIDDEVEEIRPPEEIDPEAPYGRRPDGTPYKRSPEWRATVGKRLAEARWGKPGARKKTKTSSSKEPVNYRVGVLGLLQVPAFALGVLGRSNPAYALDAAALTLHAPSIAEAIHQTAMADDRVAAILDRVLTVGPYGALLAAMVPLALQMAANHKLIAPVPEMGVLSETELLSALEKSGSQAA